MAATFANALNVPQHGAGRARKKISKSAVAAGALASLIVVGAFVGSAVTSKANDAEVMIQSNSTPNYESSSGSSSSREIDMPARESVASTQAFGGAATVDANGFITQSPGTAPTIQQQLIRSAQLTLEIPGDEFKAKYDSLVTAATGLGGLVTSASYVEEERRNGDIDRSAYVTFTVPADKYDEAVLKVRALGTTVAESASTSDVTTAVLDIDAQIRTLQASEASYLAQLAKAATSAEVIQLQDALTNVRYQLESAIQQQAYYASSTANSSFTVQLQEPVNETVAEEVVKGEPVLERAADDAGEAFLTTVGGMLIAMAWATPYLAAALVLWIVYRSVRRQPKTATPAVPVAPAVVQPPTE